METGEMSLGSMVGGTLAIGFSWVVIFVRKRNSAGEAGP
jgi:LPXTG-motif cell wall-anchored protein